jgi:hypothetical protein
LYLLDYVIFQEDKAAQAEKEARTEFPHNENLRGLATWAKLSMLKAAKSFRVQSVKEAKDAEDKTRMEKAKIGCFLGACDEILEKDYMTDEIRATILALESKDAVQVIQLFDMVVLKEAVERREALMHALHQGLRLAKEDAADIAPLVQMASSSSSSSKGKTAGTTSTCTYAEAVAKNRPAAPPALGVSARPEPPPVPAQWVKKLSLLNPRPRAAPTTRDATIPLPAIAEHGETDAAAKAIGVPAGPAAAGVQIRMPPAKAGGAASGAAMP